VKKFADATTAIESIRPHLSDFLAESGIEYQQNQYFSCINPNHDDSSPSAHILPCGTKAYCHGCGATYDILTANSWLNKAPDGGFGFLSENLLPLCEKYEIPYEIGDLTEEDKFVIDARRLCRSISDYITAQEWSDSHVKYIEERGLTAEYCKENGIGVVQDYSKLYGLMHERYTNSFLKEADLTRKSLFSPKNILFTLRDEHGSPVGFAARNIFWESEYEDYVARGKQGAPPMKYNTSSGSNRIYRKSEILYGFHDYLLRGNDSAPLYVIEGQFDRDTLAYNKVHNSVALCGTAFTSAHLSLLKRNKVGRVILLLDSDQAGQSQTEKLLIGTAEKPGLLSNTSSIKVSVLTLPEGHDPNSYILEHGIDSFKSLKAETAFEWVLKTQDPSQDPLDTCEIMIPLILKEDNVLVREEMVLSLVSSVGYSKKAMEDEIARREDTVAARILQQKKGIVEDALRQIQYTDGSGEDVLKSALTQIEQLDIVVGQDVLSVSETVTALDVQIASEADLEGPSGFKFGKLQHFQDALNGPCEGTVIGLGGVANTGKSSLQSQIAKELVEENDETIIILHTIDDNRIQMNRRLATQFAVDEANRIGSPTQITLNKIANPKYWINHSQYGPENEDLLELRSVGYTKLREYMQEGRLHVKDMTHGVTLDLLEKMVKRATTDHPNSKVVVILDNFHKTGGFGNLDERSAVKRKSAMLKTGIAQTYGITVFSTFEYKKVETGKRPSNSDLRDAVNIEYDLNYLEHLFSELKAAKDTGKEDDCYKWHGPTYAKMPIIEGDVGKNKITEFTGRHHYKFYPAQSRYECLTPDEAFSIAELKKMETSSAESEERDWAWKNGKRVNLIKNETTNPKTIKEMIDDIPF
jgi:DNA primase catalytic core